MKQIFVTGFLAGLCATAAADVAKRPVPDYDGRGDAPVTAGEVALWVPRLAVAPLYLVSEYAVRRPVGWLVVTGEREQWPRKVFDFFTTDDHKIGVIPSFFVEKGYHPTGGIYVFANDLGAAGNDLRLSGALGFGHRALTVTDRLSRGPLRFTLRAHGSDRDDLLTYGVGPESEDGDAARYQLRRYQASAAVEARAGLLRARAEVGYRDVKMSPSGCCDEPAVMAGDPRLRGYHGVTERLELALDTRVEGAGFRLAADVEHGPSWTRATGSVSATAGLGRGRRASLGVVATLVEGGGDGSAVPLPELATIGGAGPLPGFAANRLVGRSALAVAAQYEWPIWVWLNGALHAGAGDVFGERFAGLDLDLFRVSAGVGLRTTGSADQRFELLVAAGTEPLRDGGAIDSWRVLAGSTHAF